MIRPLNQICLSGFILTDIRADRDLGHSFELVQHPFQEHFHMHEQDLDRAIVIRVRLLSNQAKEDCRAYLKRGDRVTVSGRLSGAGRENLVIDATEIERSEALKTLRYVNHPWHFGEDTPPAPRLLAQKEPRG
jgi:hypothetical protein